jgi:hypothetical protein
MNDYYVQQSKVTDPKNYKVNFQDLPRDVGELCKIVQGLVTHRNASDLYGIELTEQRKNEGETRYVEVMLEKIVARDSSPLTKPRTPDKKFAGTCRDFAILLCSMLRYQGVPARLRCGFAAYFTRGPIKYEDHWVCEYWDAINSEWLLADAELDDVYKERYEFKFPIFNIPREQFILAGDAWKRCQAKEVNANDFGVGSIEGVRGLWFIRNDLVRDIAALNKFEVLPWDEWGLADKELEDMTKEELLIISQAAELTTDDTQFDEMQKLYDFTEGLKVPKVIKSHTTYSGLQMITLQD